ncbi:hypothetical protein ACNOYE_08180 [Nannocystaceae bacterium ST9]
MPYFQSFVHGRILVIRWLEPSPTGARELSRLVQRSHAAAGEPLFLAGVVSAKCPTPNTEERRALNVEHEQVADLLLSSRIVVLGRSFRQSLMRSVLANILMIARGKGRGFVIDSSAIEMAEAAHELVGVDTRWLIGRLLDVGVLLPDEVELPLAASLAR